MPPLFIKFCNKNELKYFLTIAISGCRNEITYKQVEFYDIIYPNLYVVKRLVPEHISKNDNIVDIIYNVHKSKYDDTSDESTDEEKDKEQEKDEKKDKEQDEDNKDLVQDKMTPLEYWHNYQNYTWSFDGFNEHTYNYDKDETIRDYLESLESLV